MIIANGSTDVTTYFVLRDSTNHAPKTDVTITDIDLYYVEERAAISAKADATALAAADSAHADSKAYHVGQGLYRIDWPDAAFDGGVGKKVTLIVVCTGVDTTFLEIELSPAADVRAYGGTAGTFSGGRPEVNATHWGGTAVASATVAANVTQISGDSTAADNLEAACDGTTYNIGGGAVVAASVTAEVTANVTKISGDATAADNAESFFDGTGYAGTNNVIPSVTTVTGNVNGSVGSVTGAVGSVTGNVGGNVTGSVGSVASGGITAASIATGAIDADALAADAVTEIQSGLATAAALDAVDNFVDTEVAAIKAVTDKLDTAVELDGAVYRFTTNALEQAPSGGASAADIADAVWDEAISGHLTSGTTGAALNGAGSAGDPWSTALPGAYGSGTAGKALSDILADTGTDGVKLANAAMTIDGKSLLGYLQALGALHLGDSSGMGSGTELYKKIGDSGTTRVTSVVANGARSVTLNTD